MEKFLKVCRYFLDRLGEPSTWQGIGFLVTLTGSKLGFGLDWGQAAGLGGAVSASIKMLLPDIKDKPC
jgi:hypothetical protein